MKINKIIYTWLLLFGFFQIADAQVVFKEDFGSSKVRLPSIFVPQGGNDLGLRSSPYSCTPYYRAALELYTADNRPSCNGTNLDSYNGWLKNVSDGYYLVIDPKFLKSSLGSTGGWWQEIDDHTPNDTNGAVLVINAGEVENQFYRRAVTLKINTSYRFSYYVMSNSGNVNNPLDAKAIVEVQDANERVLGKSEILGTSAHNVWEKKEYVFRTPNSTECSKFIALSIRNGNPIESGNDIYLDDIVLEEILDETAPVIACSTDTKTVDAIIKPENDTHVFGVGRFDIISNDKINTNQQLILSGTNKNANIAKVGNWPSGITIDTTTGEVVVTDVSVIPTEPLQYQVCNLLGVCSTATVTFTRNSTSSATSNIFSLTSELVDVCFTGNANEKKVRYTLKNISTRPVVIVGESSASTDGKKMKFNTSNINLSSINVISGNLELTGFLGYVKAKTFAVDEVVVFEMNFNFSNFSDEITGGLELRYGNATASGPMNKPDVKLNVSNFISRIPNKQNDIYKVLNGTGTFTIYDAAELSDADINYKFYNAAGVEVPYNTPINMSFTGELVYYYSRLSAAGCEGEKSTITFSKTDIELPQPGQISLSSTSLIEAENICPTREIIADNGNVVGQNPIKIYNKEEGKGTYVTPNGARYALKYSWEVSYDEGLTWSEFSDSDRNQEGDTSIDRKEITLQNVKSSVWIKRKAQERPEGTRPNRYSYSNIIKLKVQNNKITIAGGNFHSQPLYFLEAGNGRLNQQLNKFKLPNIITEVPSTVEYLDTIGRSYQPGSFYEYSKEGTYNFTIKVKTIGGNGVTEGCESYASLSLNVYDLNKCKVVTDKIIATAPPSASGWGTTLAGLVANKENAYDNDLSTHSTISVMVGLLGLGTTWQNLYFDELVPAGTPLHVKLGQEYSGAQVGGGITIVGLDQEGKAIGPIKSINEGGLLDLLTGDNVFEYTFVPTNARGVAQPYKGVRIILGSLVALANNAVLYGAYYEKDRVLDNNQSTEVEPIYVSGAKVPVSETQANKLKYILPTSPEQVPVYNSNYTLNDPISGNTTKRLRLNDYISDISWGNKDVGLGVATALSSVVYPYLAVDDDPFTYAIFNKTVGALNSQNLDIRLRREARPGDELEVIMTNEGINVLSLDLGADFKVQRYYDDQPVGPEVASNDFKVINFNLFLFKNPIPRFRIAGINVPFNRVVFSYTSLVQANLGNQIYLHDVSVVPQSIYESVNVTDVVNICAADFVKIQKPSACTEYKVSFVLGKIIQQTVFNSDGTSSVIDSFDELEDVILPDNLLTRIYESDSEAHYEIKRLYDLQPDQILLMKVQTVQNGQNFGGPQYLRINLNNCLDGFINPTINLDKVEVK